VRDCGWASDIIFPLADASEMPSFTGPLIRAVGPILTAPGGYPTLERWAPPAQASRCTTRGGARGADARRPGAVAIKVALNSAAGPTPSDADLEAICSAATEARLPVVAHVEGEGQTERALGAGVRELAHTPWTERLSDSLIQVLAKRTRIVSTLDIQSFGGDTPEVRTAVDNLRAFNEAGGTVLYGTDLGNGPIPPGVDVREILLLRQAGLTVEEILQAMARGPLQRNAPGDLLALGRNPFEEIDAFDDVRLVVRGGRIVA
jgi:imidazolonepropionase-like amidohydrolase